MDTGYVQLVFDVFFDATSDGNMTDNSDIPTAEFAVYVFLLSVFKSALLPTQCTPHADSVLSSLCSRIPPARPSASFRLLPPGERAIR